MINEMFVYCIIGKDMHTDNEINVIINSADYWFEEGYLNQNYTDIEDDYLEPIIRKYGLKQYIGGCFEYNDELTRGELREFLDKEGLEYCEKFERFILEADEEHLAIIEKK